jgi:hypothetical protein
LITFLLYFNPKLTILVSYYYLDYLVDILSIEIIIFLFFSWNDAPRDLPQVRSDTPTRRALRRAVAETVGKLSCLNYVDVVKFIVDVDCIVNVVKFEFIANVKLLCLFCVIVVYLLLVDVDKLLFILCRHDFF